MKQLLKELIARGKTAQTLAELQKLSLADTHLVNSILQTAARFSEMEQQVHAGTLTYDSLNVERNKINAAVLYIIDKLPQETTPDKSTPASISGGKTVIQNAEKIYNIQHIDKADFS